MPAPKQEPPVAASEAIRETFAALFPYSPLRHSLRHLGVTLAELAVTLPALEPAGEATHMETALRAAAADLRYLERFLSGLGRKASDRKLTQTDRQLARGAGRLVVRLGAAAQAIDEMVDAAQAARRPEAE
jgi:hypothetical protein